MKYALQLYSIKNISEENGLAEALKLTHKMGYDSVEFAGFFGLTTNEVLKELEKNELEVMGLHHGLGELRNSASDCVKLAKELGAYSLCVPYHMANTAEEWANFGKELNDYGKLFREAGILFGYHNHVHEFQDIEGHKPIDLILENCEKENVFFEMDTRHIALAGVNPVDYAKKYAGRIDVLHARDTDGKEDCAVGAGVVCFPEVVKCAGGIEKFVVENENFGKNEQQLIDSVAYLKKTF